MVRLLWIFLAYGLAYSQHFEILHLGVFSKEKPSITFNRYQDLSRAVAASLNDETMKGDVKLRIFQREADLMNALRSGRIHFAPLHPITYLRLKEEIPELILVAAEEGAVGFVERAVIVTPKTVSVRSLEEVKDRGFAFGPLNDPLFDWAARAALVQVGITRNNVMFKNYVDFERVSELIQVGRYQAGVLPETMIEGDHPFRVLAEVEAPGRVWVMLPDLLPFLKVRISTSLLNLDDEKIFSRLGIVNLIEIEDAELDPFRRIVSQALKF